MRAHTVLCAHEIVFLYFFLLSAVRRCRRRRRCCCCCCYCSCFIHSFSWFGLFIWFWIACTGICHPVHAMSIWNMRFHHLYYLIVKKWYLLCRVYECLLHGFVSQTHRRNSFMYITTSWWWKKREKKTTRRAQREHAYLARIKLEDT